MTTPTEAEIRGYLESLPAETWKMGRDDALAYTEVGSPFDFVESARITDDDFSVFHDALIEEITERLPTIEATLRAVLIEAQIAAIRRFFDRFPDAPLSEAGKRGRVLAKRLAKRDAVPS